MSADSDRFIIKDAGAKPAGAVAASAPQVEAAPGIATHDVEAVNKPAARPYYAARKKIYPRLVHGQFRTLKWALMLVTLGIYYIVPWFRWDRGPKLPNQAILVDVANGKMYFLWFEIWPQDLYIVTGILVVASLALFLATSIAGRVWCGYFCPQTVWTDLMLAVERFWQGDRNARIKLDNSSWLSGEKLVRKSMTHISWILIAAATGGAWVFYFTDAPTLALNLLKGEAPEAAVLFILLLTVFTYLLGGLAREQVCTYMCPWPRIQGAMFDADSLLITYRDFRGEPRGPLRKSQGWEGRGDCIDCKACVAACPMGIDIRDGAQLECIQCALCIDACDEIMGKVGKPHGLIAYDTFRSLTAEAKGGGMQLRLLRPRTILYASLLAVASAATLVGFAMRSQLEVNVLHDRDPMYVQLSNGGVRNGYTMKILNKRMEEHNFTIGVDGIENAGITIVGLDAGSGGQAPRIHLPADALRELKLHVAAPPASLAKLAPDHATFFFVIRDMADGSEKRVKADFRRPK